MKTNTALNFLVREVKYRSFFFFFSLTSCFVTAYVQYSNQFLYLLSKPLIDFKQYVSPLSCNEAAAIANGGHTFVSTNVTETFYAELLLSLFIVLWINIPFFFWQLYVLMIPGFLKKSATSFKFFITLFFLLFSILTFITHKNFIKNICILFSGSSSLRSSCSAVDEVQGQVFLEARLLPYVHFIINTYSAIFIILILFIALLIFIKNSLYPVTGSWGSRLMFMGHLRWHRRGTSGVTSGDTRGDQRDFNLLSVSDNNLDIINECKDINLVEFSRRLRFSIRVVAKHRRFFVLFYIFSLLIIVIQSFSSASIKPITFQLIISKVLNIVLNKMFLIYFLPFLIFEITIFLCFYKLLLTSWLVGDQER